MIGRKIEMVMVTVTRNGFSHNHAVWFGFTAVSWFN